jgi:uncharacterized protein (DUF2141 family)
MDPLFFWMRTAHDMKHTQGGVAALAAIMTMMVTIAIAAALALAAAPAHAQAPSAPPTASPAPPAAAPAPPAAAPAPPAVAAPAPVLQAHVIGLRSDAGDVVCSLFDDANAYPRDDSKVLRTVKAPIDHGRALCQFSGLAAGEYAIVVFHDENGDGKFNQNAFGMPEEGYGFSRDAAALFSAPTFDSAKFHYDGTRLYMIINIRY